MATRYLMDDGAEMRAIAALERVEASMRANGREVTIRTVWMELAERAAGGAGPDIAAAAALAGLAMGLTAS